MFENDRANQSGQSLIKDCHFCWWQTKGLIAAVTMIALAGCQPATMSSSFISATPKTASSPQIQQASPVPKLPESKSTIPRLRFYFLTQRVVKPLAMRQ